MACQVAPAQSVDPVPAATPLATADYVQTLTQAGFAEAHAFWFWPDFDHCTKIIPLADPVVLPYVFAPSTQPRGAKGRLKAAYKQWLVQSGWLTVTQPSLALWPTDGTAMNMILHFLNENRLALADYGATGRLSSLVITPRFQA